MLALTALQFGLPHGLGTRIYEDQSVYKGEWDTGVRSGYGVHFLATGERYDGPWEDDMKHGFGIWTTPYSDEEVRNAQFSDAQEKEMVRQLRKRFLGEEETKRLAEEEHALAKEAERRAAEILSRRAGGIGGHLTVLRTAKSEVKLTELSLLAEAEAEGAGADISVAGSGHDTADGSAGAGVKAGGAEAGGSKGDEVGGEKQSSDAMENAYAVRGAALEDSDDEGLSDREAGVVEDVEDALELSRNNYEGAALYEWRQKGYWVKFQEHRVHALEMLQSKVSTIQFKMRFPLTSKDPTLFTSAFANSVAEHLPFLPDGVDPNDLVVRYIVERLIEEQQANAASEGINIARRKVEEVVPKLRQATDKYLRIEEKVLLARRELEEKEQNEARIRERVEELRAQATNLNGTLKLYWEDDPRGVRESYDEAVENLKKVTKTDWYRLRTMMEPYPTQLIGALMKVFAIIVGSDSGWASLNLWFQNSDTNVRAGNRMALIRKYEVRLLDYVLHGDFDVYALARSMSVMEQARIFMANPNLSPDNQNLSYHSKALPAVCGWVRAAYSVARYAGAMLPKRKELGEVMVQLEASTALHEKALDELRKSQSNLDELDADLLTSSNARHEGIEKLLEARRLLIEARAIRRRYLGERGLSTLHGDDLSVGREFIPYSVEMEEQKVATAMEERRNSMKTATDLIDAVRQFWDRATTKEERLLLLPGEEEEDDDGGAAADIDELDAAYGSSSDDDDEDLNWVDEGVGEDGGWVEMVDEETKEPYLYNTATGEARWMDEIDEPYGGDNYAVHREESEEEGDSNAESGDEDDDGLEEEDEDCDEDDDDDGDDDDNDDDDDEEDYEDRDGYYENEYGNEEAGGVEESKGGYHGDGDDADDFDYDDQGEDDGDGEDYD